MTPASSPPTRCDIDLDAIAANCAAIGARAGASLIAVVKADGYGHGAEAVAEVALESGAAMLAVATVEEALLLRRAGIVAEILVFLGAADAPEAGAAVAARLTLAVWDEAGARQAAEAARAERTTVALHLKIDTGLTRLGVPLETAVALWALVRSLPGVRLEGIYTHLATADERDLTAARGQLASFAEVLAAFAPPRWVHALATAGLAAFGPLPGCTAVRAGIGLYGIAPAAHLAGVLSLAPALSWRTRVLRVADAPRGTGVSYGHEFRLPADGRIATIGIGYADGLPRSAWPRVRVLVPGGAAPVAGRVSMDLTTLDATALPALRAGDEAVLIGRLDGIRQTAGDLAASCGTIAYETLSRIGARVPRHYQRGGRVVATKTLTGGYVRC